MMTPKERAVMQQALEALEEMSHSNSTKVAVEKYNTAHNALLEALEQPDEIDWIVTNKALANEIIELQKKAEQEPVGHLCEASFGRGQVFWFNKPADNTPLYSAPVHTKDLTDDEIDAIEIITDRQFARAVIAADREKNK